MWAPYLAWQASHGWPQVAVAQSIAGGGSGTSAPRWTLLPYQLLLAGVALSPVWVAGVVRLLRGPALRWCRAFGVTFTVLVIVFTVTGGKPYYLGAMFPVLLAAGAQPAVGWARRGRARPRTGLLAAALILTPLITIPVALPAVPVADLHRTSIVAVNYDAGETIGWPAYVRQIAAVYWSLPVVQRSKTIVVGSNYGEAGAVDHLGRPYGLPAAYGVHNAYWYWGPPPASATAAVAVGFGRPTLTPVCGTLRLAAHLNNHLGVNDDRAPPEKRSYRARSGVSAQPPRPATSGTDGAAGYGVFWPSAFAAGLSVPAAYWRRSRPAACDQHWTRSSLLTWPWA